MPYEQLCTGCERWQPLENYNRDKKRATGRGNLCKDCTRAYTNSYYSEKYKKAAAQRKAEDILPLQPIDKVEINIPPDAPKVYLAGAINGLTPRTARMWRHVARHTLGMAHAVGVLDPMREKDWLAEDVIIDDSTRVRSVMSPEEIFMRDISDINEADVFFANFLHWYGDDEQGTPGTKGLGTPAELGYAYALGKPIVCLMPAQMVRHPFAIGMCTYITEEWVDALEMAAKLAHQSKGVEKIPPKVEATIGQVGYDRVIEVEDL